MKTDNVIMVASLILLLLITAFCFYLFYTIIKDAGQVNCIERYGKQWSYVMGAHHHCTNAKGEIRGI